MRLDLQMNARNRGSFMTKDMVAALQEIGALKVTSYGAGSYEIWAPMYHNTVEFLRTMETRVDKLGVDVEYRSHDLMTFTLARGAGGYTERGAAYAAVSALKDVMCVEVDGANLRVFAKLGAVKREKVAAALKEQGLELKEPEPRKK
jgi:hypothetical protein